MRDWAWHHKTMLLASLALVTFAAGFISHELEATGFLVSGLVAAELA